MSKYIKIDTALLKTVATGGISAKALWKRIMQQPSIDIVHCKDCTFAKPTNTENVIQCTWLSGYTFRKNHYCSAGERIEE